MRFTIDAVVKLTGIPASSLRNWEKRFSFPRPLRSETGHRSYSAQDVEFLKKASQALLMGYALKEIANHYPQGPQALDVLLGAGGPQAHLPLLDDVDFRVNLIYDSLLDFDSASILQQFLILNSKLSPVMMFDRVFETILKRLGEDWSRGKISIAQEHFASSFLRIRLAQFLCLDFPPSLPFKILAMTSEGERHEGGLMLIASHLKYRGFEVVYLGADLPFTEIQVLTQEIEPDLVCLSYTNGSNLIRDFEGLLGLPSPVAIGGLGLRGVPHDSALWEKSKGQLHFISGSPGSQAAAQLEMICQSLPPRDQSGIG